MTEDGNNGMEGGDGVDDVKLVCPGDLIGKTSIYAPGIGVYVANKNEIRASVVGAVTIENFDDNKSKARINVVFQKPHVSADYVLRVGDVVLCQVTRTNYNQAFVDVHCIGDKILPTPIKAVIRREDVREHEIDKVVIQEFFKPMDTVRAAVISLGDNKYYFLSTAKNDLGVVLPQLKVPET